jgi:hypothetical protein
MTDTLKSQLDSLGTHLPVIKTDHYVLLHHSSYGPVAFLLEKRRPRDETATFRMESVIQPAYQTRLHISRQGRLIPEAVRTRSKFHYRRPRKSVLMPADVKCPKRSRWIKLHNEQYDQLRIHDNGAWELLLGDLLDIPSKFTSGPRSSVGNG